MPGARLHQQLVHLSPNARRRIVIIISALATFATVDAIIRRGESSLAIYSNEYYSKKCTAITQRPMPGIFLLGSSRSQYALIPAEFHRATGLDAYNFGISGSKVAEWQLLARRFLQDRTPRLVVLGVNASEFRADYSQTQAARHLFNWNDLIETSLHDGPSLDILGAYARRKLGPLWATYHRSGELQLWAAEQLAAILPKQAQLAREIRERMAGPLPPDGYDHPWTKGKRLKSIEEQLLANPVAVESSSIPTFDSDAFTFRRFGEMLDWLHARRIPAIVAYIPNCPRTEQRWAGVEPQFITAIAALCRDHGVTFIPCDRQTMPRTNRDFLDEVHVGYPLAQEISRRVARQAVALNLVPGIAPTVAQGTPEPETQP